jgi:alkyl hydroperoxide reductase subunit AhpF
MECSSAIPRYDVVIVGARPAGAATALLHARHGRRPLLPRPDAVLGRRG